MFVGVAFAVAQEASDLCDAHVVSEVFGEEVSESADEGRETEGVWGEEVVDVGHFFG